LDKLQKDNPIKFVLHFDSLDQGTEAFMQWLGSDDKTSASGNPIIPKQYEHNKYAVLYENSKYRSSYGSINSLCLLIFKSKE
jgi:hypothetical protein